MAINYQVMYHLNSSQLPAQRATVLAGVGATGVWAAAGVDRGPGGPWPGATAGVKAMAGMVYRWATAGVAYSYGPHHWNTAVGHTGCGPQPQATARG